jgi:N-acetyl sugar amidotransferase
MKIEVAKQAIISKYGLPLEVKFCKRCVISNQRPSSTNEYFHTKDTKHEAIKFDEEDVCYACKVNEAKDKHIDWQKREKQLKDLLDKYRSKDGSYDILVPGSGGKDSTFQAHTLKYKYNMHPLTVTWSPHLYTNIGWKNFQSWLHKGGFDNYLFTPNPRIHSLLTKLAIENLLHPFQPFILGQKTFAPKMAAKFGIKLIVYGEMPAEYGADVSVNESSFRLKGSYKDGHSIDYALGRDAHDLYLGGVKVGEIMDRYKVTLGDLNAYLPMKSELITENNIEFHYLGYYLKWTPQESYYYAVENTGFEANPERTEGTYSKYNSLDDKIDGFHYYTTYIKFGLGRASYDASQEIRNKHLTRKEGVALVHRFDGEFPNKYFKDIMTYIGMKPEHFLDLCDKFRSPHLWHKVNGEWKLKVKVS